MSTGWLYGSLLLQFSKSKLICSVPRAQECNLVYECVGGRVVCFLFCSFQTDGPAIFGLLAGRMKLASLGAKFDGGGFLLVFPILRFTRPKERSGSVAECLTRD